MAEDGLDAVKIRKATNPGLSLEAKAEADKKKNVARVFFTGQ